MDILILNWKDTKNPEVGGAELIAFEFARRLVKDGHSVTYFSRSFPNAVEKETLDGITVIRGGNKFSVYLQAFLYYRSLKEKPDIVVDMVNTICWQTPFYVPKEKRITYVNQLAKEVLFYELPWPLSWVAYILEPFEYLPYKTTRFLCYSNSTEEDLKTFGIPEKNIKLFPLGLDHKRYVPGKKKADYPLFIFVARLVRMKRADLCIQAMKEVVKAHPDAKLAIVGNGKEESSLEELIHENGLSENVTLVNKNNFFVDMNTKDVKVRLMQEAWALLLPSVKEGWGMVVTEAAACGTPSIVSNATGLRDSVRNNETGLILSKNPTPQELAKAMIQLIEDKKLRDKLSKGAMSWSKQFNWDTSYNEFSRHIFSYAKEK